MRIGGIRHGTTPKYTERVREYGVRSEDRRTRQSRPGGNPSRREG